MWLLNYEWGPAIADTIEDFPDPRRRVAWIRMVMDMKAVMSGAVAPAAGTLACREHFDDLDARRALPIVLLE